MGTKITGYPDHFIVNGDTTSCPCLEHSPLPARAELERQALNVGSPEYDVWFGLLLDRYRAEVLHEAAERIRAAQFGPEGQTWDWWDSSSIPRKCADLIDSEVT
ncbi:hypothetical protein [Streptomyces sp. NPDC002346]